MKINVGQTERALRIIIGVVISVYYTQMTLPTT